MAAPDIKKYNFYILSVKKNSICKSTKIITQMYICEVTTKKMLAFPVEGLYPWEGTRGTVV
jgi:hypothetical protein